LRDRRGGENYFPNPATYFFKDHRGKSLNDLESSSRVILREKPANIPYSLAEIEKARSKRMGIEFDALRDPWDMAVRGGLFGPREIKMFSS